MLLLRTLRTENVIATERLIECGQVEWEISLSFLILLFLIAYGMHLGTVSLPLSKEVHFKA